MDNLPIILGVCGTMGTGKDTIADFFVSVYGFKQMAMADPLKHTVKDLFDISEDVLWGPSENRTPEVRRLLQQLGTEVAREYDPEIWVNKTRERLKVWREKGIDLYDHTAHPRDNMEHSVVISDIRFPNEAEMLYEHPRGYLLKLERKTTPNTNAAKHSSETGVLDIPEKHFYTAVDNNGTIKELHNKLREIYCNILVGPINDPS